MSNWDVTHANLNNRSLLAAVLHRCAWLLVAGLFVALIGSVTASTVPEFSDTFTYDNGTDLSTTNDWGVSGSGTAIATNNTAQLIDITLTNAFSDSETAVSITFELQPQFSDSAPTIPDDATYAFYVGTNGIITAYDGTTPSNLTHTPLSNTSFTNIQVDLDYSATNWSLTVGSSEIATDFDFYSTSNSVFTQLAFTEGSTNASYIDTVDVQLAATPTTTTVAPTTTTAAPTTTTAAPTTTTAAPTTTTAAPTTTTVAATTTTTTAAPSVLPFAETFEPLTEGALNAQSNWVASAAIVQTNVYNGGSQAGALTNDSATAKQLFDGAETNEVWTDLYIQPVFGADDASVTNVPAGATFAFYVNTDSNVVAYISGGSTTLTATAISEGAWTRFTVRSDYTTDTWDLEVAGIPVATGLSFINAADGYEEFGLQGADTAYVDDINIVLSDPLPPTTTTAAPTTTTVAPTTTAAATTTTAAATTTTAAATTTTAAATTTTAAATTTTAAATTTTAAATTTTAAATTTTVAATTTTTTVARPIPFGDGFEDYARGGGVNGQAPSAYSDMSWVAVDTMVTNSPVSGGTNAVALTSTDASAVQTFNDGKTAVWTDMYLKPVIGDTASVTNPPSGAAFAFYVNSSSNVVVYTNGVTKELSTTVDPSVMTWFAVNTDHSAKTWDLYVGPGSTPVAEDLPFSDAAAGDSYTELGILYGDATTPAIVDDINIGTTSPFAGSGTLFMFR
ncbi:MAG: hypothetical protein QGH42_09055 [Kiritimatiellia bacterium]|nr:hypothetical protein [Kiritimatiellia bacterium]